MSYLLFFSVLCVFLQDTETEIKVKQEEISYEEETPYSATTSLIPEVMQSFPFIKI